MKRNNFVAGAGLLFWHKAFCNARIVWEEAAAAAAPPPFAHTTTITTMNGAPATSEAAAALEPVRLPL